MRAINIAITICFIALVTQLGILSEKPGSDPAEQNVIKTAFWTLTFSGLVTSICAITTYSLGSTDHGSEIVVCLPYSVPTAAITIRAHIFAVGGYGRKEWNYIKSIPSRTSDFLWERVVDAWRLTEDELSRLGLLDF